LLKVSLFLRFQIFIEDKTFVGCAFIIPGVEDSKASMLQGSTTLVAPSSFAALGLIACFHYRDSNVAWNKMFASIICRHAVTC